MLFQCPYGLFGDSDRQHAKDEFAIKRAGFNALTGFLVILTRRPEICPVHRSGGGCFNALTGFLVILTSGGGLETSKLRGLRFQCPYGLFSDSDQASRRAGAIGTDGFNALTGFLVILTLSLPVTTKTATMYVFQCPYGLFGDSDKRLGRRDEMIVYRFNALTGFLVILTSGCYRQL